MEQYQPPPAFTPPESRAGPLHPDQARWLLQQQSGYPSAYPAYPTPPRTPWGRLVVAAVVATTLLAFGLVVLFRASGGHQSADRSISLPGSAGEYQLSRSIDGPTIERLLGGQLSSLGPLQDALDTAKVGIYGRPASAGSTLVFLGFNAADEPSIRHLLSAGSDSVAAQLLSGAGVGTPVTFPPGPLGGTLECSQAAQGGTAFTPCVWADRSTVAMVLQLGRLDLDGASAVTLQFRAAAEH